MSILREQSLNISLKLRQFLPAQPCLLCGSLSNDGLWCGECDADLPYLRPGQHCPQCALPSPLGALCGQCLQHPPPFDASRAVFAYHFPLDKLIQQLKYAEELPLAHALAERLAQRVADSPRPDYLIPMPLHPARLRERGYNQSLLLARHLGHWLSVPVLPTACSRILNTPSQTSLPREERLKNVRGAFQCHVDLRDKFVVLVDDVLTTGASLGALAQVVRAHGASRVEGWVVARSMAQSPSKV